MDRPSGTLRVAGLQKSFGDVQALRDCSFSIEQDQMLARFSDRGRSAGDDAATDSAYGGYLASTTSLTNPDNVVIRVLSFATLGLVTVLAARSAGRLYHVSLLQAGSRISWRRALRIMREA